MESVKNHPNFDMTLKVTEKLLQIRKPIKTAVIVAIIEGETSGSVIVGDQVLTEKDKFNTLVCVMQKLGLSWSYILKKNPGES